MPSVTRLLCPLEYTIIIHHSTFYQPLSAQPHRVESTNCCGGRIVSAGLRSAQSFPANVKLIFVQALKVQWSDISR